MTSSQANRRTSQPVHDHHVVATRIVAKRGSVAVPLERVGLKDHAQILVHEVRPKPETGQGQLGSHVESLDPQRDVT